MFVKKEAMGIPFYAPFTDIPFCRAGITTRHGGVSAGYFASLNLGLRTDDTKENLDENVRRLCTVFGKTPADAVSTRQEHGKCVRRVGKAEAGTGFILPRFAEGVDGLVTNEPGVLLVSYYADCVPVLLCDAEKRAVGAVHSGWRGTVREIAAEAVRLMEKEFASRPEEIHAAIGPHIGGCCFAVDTPVYDAFRAAFPEDDGFLCRVEGEKYHIDLAAAVTHSLKKTGVQKIVNMRTCTACHAETFFSHRKSGGKRGCFAAAICIE